MTAHPSRSRRTPVAGIDPWQLLNALPEAMLVLDGDGVIRFVNLDAQRFLAAGEAMLLGQRLTDWLPEDSPIFSLIRQALAEGSSMSEYGLTLETPRIGAHPVTASVAPIGDPPTQLVVSIREISIAQRFDNQFSHRNAARSVTAMSAMLAHEVKNPLAGIRGGGGAAGAAPSRRERTASSPSSSATKPSASWQADGNRVEQSWPMHRPGAARRGQHPRCARPGAARWPQNGVCPRMCASSRTMTPRCPPVVGDRGPADAGASSIFSRTPAEAAPARWAA